MSLRVEFLSKAVAELMEGQRPASIPAQGNALGNRPQCTGGLKARSIPRNHTAMARAFSPLGFFAREFLGRCPRLVWVAPLAHRHGTYGIFYEPQPTRILVTAILDLRQDERHIVRRLRH